MDAVLKDAGIMRRSLATNQGLMYVMLYDHLFGRGIQGGGAVKRAIKMNDTKLKEALNKLMKKKNVSCVKELVAHEIRDAPEIPRFARVNLWKTTAEAVEKHLTEFVYTIDETIPYVLSFESGTDLHDHPLVNSGELVLQDKSSCFPAHALHLACEISNISKGDAIDATAAPGNKTSQLGSLGFRKVFAFDKSARRLDVLKQRMGQAGFDESKISPTCCDFLKVDPLTPEYQEVNVILCDPSCSGSGMHRLDHLMDKKVSNEEEEMRLMKLAEFQVACVNHALKFPKVHFVSYSTCSIHTKENEDVVAQVLKANPGFELHKAIPAWSRRGRETPELSKQQADSLIRVDPNEDRSCGFFVAIFARKLSSDLVIGPNYSKNAKKREKKKRRKEELGNEKKKAKIQN